MYRRFPEPEEYDFVHVGDLVDMTGWYNPRTGKNRSHVLGLISRVISTHGDRNGVSAAVDVMAPGGELISCAIVRKHQIIPCDRDEKAP